MRFDLDRTSQIPLYRQLEARLREAIRAGDLPVGTRLPATRRLALDLGISRLTVDTAYAELLAEGWLEGQGARGTLIRSRPSLPDPAAPALGSWPGWQERASHQLGRFAAAPAVPASALTHPDLIDFASGTGDPQLLPARELQRLVAAVKGRVDPGLMTYGDARGLPELRRLVAEILGSQGMRTHADQVLITAGSQQAIALVTQAITRPGDAVLVEAPCYASALELFRALGLRTIGVPVDHHGMRVELLPELVSREQPALIYTVPNFHNPTGTCMSGPRRRELLAIATRLDLPILEDDYVGELRYEGRVQPPLKALDPGGRVIHVGTFSKMLLPGLRTGFLTVDGPFLATLAELKRVSDLAGPMLVQQALADFIGIGRYQAHLRRSRRAYAARRDVMLATLARELPEVVVRCPQGGLFLWARLPVGCDSTHLLASALATGVAFAPGGRHFADPGEGQGYLRLNFALHAPARIEEGIRRLGRAYRQLGRA